jgi:hypothetical protein
MKPQPPLPEPINVPPQVIQRWMSMPAERVIDRTLTKADWDNIFFCLDHAIRASAELQSALIAYTNGSLEDANAHSWEASRRQIEAQNKLRQIMTSVMVEDAA